MNHRISLSPQTDGTGMRIVIGNPWSTPPENLQRMKFWRSRLEYRSELNLAKKGSRVNWNAVLGLTITLGISSGFWIGMALAVAKLWK